MLGFGSIGELALGEIPAVVMQATFSAVGTGAFAPKMTATIQSVLASAGASSPSFKMAATVQSVFASVGAGGTSIVLHSFNGAVFASVGASGPAFGGSRIDNRVLSIAGVGAFLAEGYAFFVDAEVACVHEEGRTILISPDLKIAIVAAEDRVYEVEVESRRAPTPNRKRVC